MGRGSSTKQLVVVKNRPPETIASATGSSRSNSNDSCLFSFTEIVNLTSQSMISIQKDNSVVMVSNYNNVSDIEIYIQNVNFGSYTGRYLNRIIKCINEGYTYEGFVSSVTSTAVGYKVNIFIQGHKR
ncbi:MAG: hypothetical protein Q8P20_09065 [bacterium]|nr:hypothetical protein [bacterium]